MVETIAQPPVTQDKVAASALDRLNTLDTKRSLRPFRASPTRSQRPLTERMKARRIATATTTSELDTDQQLEILKAQLGLYGTVDMQLRAIAQSAEERAKQADQLRGQLSESEKEKEAAIKLSMTDELTGLPNFRWLKREFDRKVAKANETGQPLWMLQLDFDKFKDINTNYGNKGGDEALRAIRSLEARTEENEDIARIGGDEFGQLIVGNLSEEEMKLIVARHVDAMRKASARILAGMSPLPGQDPIKEFALCIGITAYQPGDTLETLKDRSDLGVKQAKKDPDKGTGYLIRMENGAPTPIPLKLQLAA